MKVKIINSQTNEELQEFDLVSAIRNNGKCIVGRSATSGLILENSDISRQHGEFSYKSGEYYFTDTGSSNGSLINNQFATKDRAYLLKAGDVIRLGDFLLIPQPITGAYENATVIVPMPFTFLSNGSKPSDSIITSSGHVTIIDARTDEESLAATAAEPEDVEHSDIDDIPLEESIEDIPAKVTDATTLQESISPEAMAESDAADIPAVIAEKPKPQSESHTDTTVAEGFVEENTHIQTSPPEFINMESTDAIVSPTSEAIDEELSDRNDISAVPEILKEKYIVLLAHDSQKAELVDFIERHQVTFSKCLLMASSAISDALVQHNIVVSRKLSNLTAGGYQEVNSELASKNLLGVIFLRDFLVLQSTQANDEALSRSCNVNQVILATNIATAQAFEGYLQHLIASNPKISLAESSRQ